MPLVPKSQRRHRRGDTSRKSEEHSSPKEGGKRHGREEAKPMPEASTDRTIEIRPAQPTDIPRIISMLEAIANDNGHQHLFDASHAWAHITGIVCDGVSFVAEAGNSIIGVAMSEFIDLGYARTDHLELIYLYVSPNWRKSRATFHLLQALEDYADRNNIIIIFYQLDYPNAINGDVGNAERVERLFQFRDYDGPIDVAFLRQPRVRVGVSYMYNGTHNGRQAAKRDHRA